MKSFRYKISAWLVLSLLLTGFARGQNIMKISSVQGTVNDTTRVSLCVKNDREFIAFQCDILLPEGFQYVPNSIILTDRKKDHVISSTPVDSNGIRLVCYSPGNAAFLSDSGAVATFLVADTNTVGTYPIRLVNGILGNAQSKNILDSIVNGEIILSPLSISTSRNADQFRCLPNPFHRTITVETGQKNGPVRLQVYDMAGRLLTSRILSGNRHHFNVQGLLGRNAKSGTYFFRFGFIENNRPSIVVKKLEHQPE